MSKFVEFFKKGKVSEDNKNMERQNSKQLQKQNSKDEGQKEIFMNFAPKIPRKSGSLKEDPRGNKSLPASVKNKSLSSSGSGSKYGSLSSKR